MIQRLCRPWDGVCCDNCCGKVLHPPTYYTTNLQLKYKCFISNLKKIQFSQTNFMVWNILEYCRSIFKIRIYICFEKSINNGSLTKYVLVGIIWYTSHQSRIKNGPINLYLNKKNCTRISTFFIRSILNK